MGLLSSSLRRSASHPSSVSVPDSFIVFVSNNINNINNNNNNNNDNTTSQQHQNNDENNNKLKTTITTTTTTSSSSELPLNHIFSFLPEQSDVLLVALVSRKWSVAAFDPQLWRRRVSAVYGSFTVQWIVTAAIASTPSNNSSDDDNNNINIRDTIDWRRVARGVYLHCLPLPVRSAIHYLHSHPLPEGVYRTPGNKARVAVLRRAFRRGVVPDLSADSLYTVADALKHYLGEDGFPKQECVVGDRDTAAAFLSVQASANNRAVTSANTTDNNNENNDNNNNNNNNTNETDIIIREFKEVIAGMDAQRRILLRWVLLHLRKVTQDPVTRMTPVNVAMVFGSVLFPSRVCGETSLPLASPLVVSLLRYQDSLF